MPSYSSDTRPVRGKDDLVEAGRYNADRRADRNRPPASRGGDALLHVSVLCWADYHARAAGAARGGARAMRGVVLGTALGSVGAPGPNSVPGAEAGAPDRCGLGRRPAGDRALPYSDSSR